MRQIIGFALIVVGGVSAALTEIPYLSIIAIVGVFMFASFLSHNVFVDYAIANTTEFIVRKRYYIDFLPFTIISYVLTLKRATLQIPYKEEYYRFVYVSDDNIQQTKISRKEYISIRNEQRKIYSTQVFSREFMERSYTIEDIGFRRKKARLITASILAGIMLTMLVEPEAAILTVIYEAVFLPMVILWIPDYKDAKILHNAYLRSVNGVLN